MLISANFVEQDNGTLSFTTYEDKPVNPCNDVEGKYYTDRSMCVNGTDYSQIEIGVYYNDLWAYRLCDMYNSTNTTGETGRYFDTQCEGEGWVNWHIGAREGGCTIELGSLVRFFSCLLSNLKIE